MCAEKKVVNEKAIKNIATGTREENIFDGVRIMCKFQLIIKLLLISTYSLKWGKKKISCKTMLQEVPNSIHSSDYILLYSQDKTRIKAINRCVLLLP